MNSYGKNRERWSISKSGRCLGKSPNDDGYFTFTFESSPSSRDDVYYQEYRFNTAAEAYQFWNDNRSRIIATQIEIINYYRNKVS